MDAIILAGGLGTRLGKAAGDLPKPMAPVHGRPFLEYLLDYWKGQGIRRFVLAVSHQYEKIQKHFGQNYKSAEIVYSVETEPAGTGGALLQALGYLKSPGPFLALNGDTFFEVGFADFTAFHKANHADISIALSSRPQDDRYETVLQDAGGRIQEFKGRGQGGGPAWINGGVYLFEPESLRGMAGPKPSLEKDLFPKLLKAGRKCFGFKCMGKFIDIGVPESYEAAKKIVGEA